MRQLRLIHFSVPFWRQTGAPHSVCGCRHAGAVHRNQRIAVRHFRPYSARHEDVSPRCQPSREAVRHIEVQPCRAFSPSCGSLHLPNLRYLHLFLTSLIVRESILTATLFLSRSRNIGIIASAFRREVIIPSFVPSSFNPSGILFFCLLICL